MELVGTVRIAARALGRHKLRTFLTMLGMIIGVAAVMTMVALGGGAQASVEDEMKSAGTNLVYVSAGNYVRGGDDIKVASGLGSAKTLVPADVDAIRSQVRGIKFISPGVSDRAPMTAADKRYFGRVVGVSAEFGAMHSWTIRRGGAMFGPPCCLAACEGRGARHQCCRGALRAGRPYRADLHHSQRDVHRCCGD